MHALTPPTMTVIDAADIAAQINGSRPELLEVVRRAYLAHDAGQSSNPHSSFLRFPHQSRSRVISLPAYLGGEFDVAGNKWIASFPDNVQHGIPRASATLILNDCVTGYPFACMESSVISATRTAASAVLGAEVLLGERRARRVGVVGTGLIAQHVWKFLRDLDWEIGAFRLFDLNRDAAERYGLVLKEDSAAEVEIAERVEDAFADCDLVVITTVAGEPHLHDPELLAHGPVVLHLSLRDLSPDVVLTAQNFTDDVDHAVRERTSLHLTEQVTGNRDFIDGTIGDLLAQRETREPGRPAIFAPFGLGVLDLAVGKWVHDRLVEAGKGHRASDFFTGVEV
ncbi:2,3-diaminopropionate biosynthesis protein SbnB [Streptomyces violarus]|uniref:Ornithine cyclodeaminase n=2 Tax=Streptomyces TaxID=1883 RepID=A0A7W4ZT61_9ACTN|nr:MULTISPECIES: 2,3-diaminopropionate biosynthesis protein SbnB [Streptomyces]MBB3078188.1 ornithine cyclodeaminase [Streptomyces violarus]WRT99661.1 2,3-diaminopropionate biosynthesis protein SbnB [Streptomyces sp. CGMCC 4.1772]GHD20082.1 2,3-diaminopropionate biosynthesis protein SbnB [Streptomyces violarus]